jgi:hypothetical protein
VAEHAIRVNKSFTFLSRSVNNYLFLCGVDEKNDGILRRAIKKLLSLVRHARGVTHFFFLENQFF